MLHVSEADQTLLVFHFCIETKELCEARVNLEMSSYFQMMFPQIDPPFETASERSGLFADLCHH